MRNAFPADFNQERRGTRHTHSCLEAALLYANRYRLPVFPVRGKVPFPGTKGFKDASLDSDVIRSWWKTWPDANVAIPTGAASRWLVMDFDGPAGLDSLRCLEAMARHRAADLQQAYRPLRETLIARTRRGVHLVYEYPVQGMRNTVEFAGLAGVDVRGEGGYIVVAPSLHPDGYRYRWLSFRRPASLPQIALDLQARRRSNTAQAGIPHPTSGGSHSPQPGNPEDFLTRALARAQVGSRHTCALWLAWRLIRDAKLTIAQAEDYMRAYVRAVPGGGEDYPLADALQCLYWVAEQ